MQVDGGSEGGGGFSSEFPHGNDLFDMILNNLSARQLENVDFLNTGGHQGGSSGSGRPLSLLERKRKYHRSRRFERREGVDGTGKQNVAEDGKGKGKSPETQGPQSFWGQVEDYMRGLTADDIRLLLPVANPENDSAFEVPPLGRNHTLVWAEQDKAEVELAEMEAAQLSLSRAKRKLINLSPINEKIRMAAGEEAGAGDGKGTQVKLVVLPQGNPGGSQDERLMNMLEASDTQELVRLTKEVLAATKITQTAAAGASGVSQSMLSTWLQGPAGGREKPSLPVINAKIRLWLCEYVVMLQVTDAPPVPDPVSLGREEEMACLPFETAEGVQVTTQQINNRVEVTGVTSVAGEDIERRKVWNSSTDEVERGNGLGPASVVACKDLAGDHGDVGARIVENSQVERAVVHELNLDSMKEEAEERKNSGRGQSEERGRQHDGVDYDLTEEDSDEVVLVGADADEERRQRGMHGGASTSGAGGKDMTFSQRLPHESLSGRWGRGVGAHPSGGSMVKAAPGVERQEGRERLHNSAKLKLETPPSITDGGVGLANTSDNSLSVELGKRQEHMSDANGADIEGCEGRGVGAGPLLTKAKVEPVALDSWQGEESTEAGGTVDGSVAATSQSFRRRSGTGSIHKYILSKISRMQSLDTMEEPGFVDPSVGCQSVPEGLTLLRTPSKVELDAVAVEVEFSPRPLLLPEQDAPSRHNVSGSPSRSSSGMAPDLSKCQICTLMGASANCGGRDASSECMAPRGTGVASTEDPGLGCVREMPSVPSEGGNGTKSLLGGPLILEKLSPQSAIEARDVISMDAGNNIEASECQPAKEDGSTAMEPRVKVENEELDPCIDEARDRIMGLEVHASGENMLAGKQDGSRMAHVPLDAADTKEVQWEQLSRAREQGLLNNVPEDEIMAELLILQSQLLLSIQANRVRSERLVAKILKVLPEEQLRLQKREEDMVFVAKYMAMVREAKKQDRKVKKDKEAQAVLAAATAAAAASPRVSIIRREDDTSYLSVGGAAGLSLMVPSGEMSRPPASKPPLPKPPPLRIPGPRMAAAAPWRTSGLSSQAATPIYDLLPGSRISESDAVCAVCSNGDSERPNQIVFCDRCGVAVHQECYGIARIPPGPWFCQPCLDASQDLGPSPGDSSSRQGPGVQCAICPGRVGAFRPTPDGGWAHVFCAQWMPETFVGKDQSDPVTGLNDIPAERWALLCGLCHQDHGASLKCNFGHCAGSFHPSCARNAGLFMHVKAGPGGRLQFRAYCDRHSPMQRAKAESKLRGGPEDMAVLRRIRVEFERVRLICERIIRRENVKRELLLCMQELVQSTAVASRETAGLLEALLLCLKSRGRKVVETFGPERSGTEGQLGHVRGPSGRFHRKRRKAWSKVPGEILMTQDEATMLNERLPKGYAYVPLQVARSGYLPRTSGESAPLLPRSHIEQLIQDPVPKHT